MGHTALAHFAKRLVAIAHRAHCPLTIRSFGALTLSPADHPTIYGQNRPELTPDNDRGPQGCAECCPLISCRSGVVIGPASCSLRGWLCAGLLLQLLSCCVCLGAPTTGMGRRALRRMRAGWLIRMHRATEMGQCALRRMPLGWLSGMHPAREMGLRPLRRMRVPWRTAIRPGTEATAMAALPATTSRSRATGPSARSVEAVSSASSPTWTTRARARFGIVLRIEMATLMRQRHASSPSPGEAPLSY